MRKSPTKQTWRWLKKFLAIAELDALRLAQVLNVNPKTVGNWHCLRSMPNLKQLTLSAHALGVTPSELLLSHPFVHEMEKAHQELHPRDDSNRAPWTFDDDFGFDVEVQK